MALTIRLETEREVLDLFNVVAMFVENVEADSVDDEERAGLETAQRVRDELAVEVASWAE